ncbi:2-hydroxyacid dehydrogenase [Afifella pfennigii]|uniref:2-hydroxyacid dehydrogenase n=1 Tax=Afifella pfennigii TaxID=209897 RepID=UPI00047C1009|nr:2-hydroxyacid dehydrogenase [Afifella pfennigii]
MGPEILLAAKLPPEHAAAIEKEFTVHRLLEADDRDAFLRQVGPSVRGVVTSGVRGFDKALLDALPLCEIVSVWGAGLQALDLNAARARGIAVTNTPDDSKIAVAELGMALLLAAARWVPDGDRFVRDGRWASESYSRLGTGLAGKTCGIVALGTIGRAVAARAAAFDMRVAYFGPRKKDDVAYRYYADVKALAVDSDFLVLCCPETEETRGLIDADVLAALGAGGILVNVARGKVVEEAALTEALGAGTIRAAALDVFANEPEVPEALRRSERLVAVPHIGTQIEDVREKRKRLTVENLKAYFAGEPLPGPVHVPG